MSLVETAAAFLAKAGVAASDPVLVGCSGGPDSVVLADIACRLSRGGQLGPVHLLHVDHGLRPDSHRDADRVRALGSDLGAEVHVVCVEVERRASLEAAARDARYQAMRRMARDLDIDWVLLAHTASDQAETVLMRLLRGTGLVGLAGIPPQRGRYLRPLITATRKQILGYLDQRGLDACADPMNDDPAFLRTRVRQRWLPELSSENPRLPEALVRLAESAREQREVLDFAADQLLESARLPGRPHTYSVEKLRTSPAAVVKRALSCAAQTAGGEPLASAHLSAAVGLLRSTRGGTLSLDLPKLRLVREYDIIRWVAAQPMVVEAGECDGALQKGRFVVRRWQPGDRMRPRRLKGRSRKLSDLFIDQRVPREQRNRARVVTLGDGEIVWAEHIGPAYGHEIDVKLGPDPVVTCKN